MEKSTAVDFALLREHGQYNIAIFGGGCFWCMQSPFETVNGVIKCIAGYSGGNTINPDYHHVCSGQTGHIEVMLVLYKPDQVSYEQLLTVFWRNIDPTQVNGQFADHGSQYTTVIFYLDDAQKQLATQSRDQLAASGKFDKPIVTKILPAVPVYPAEACHQGYYRKNPLRYRMYHSQSGREAFIKSVWTE